MSFVDFQKHCMECEKGKPCGKYHIYVLTLQSEVASRDWFLEANPDYVDGRECLYVGMTSHLPKCRASQHQFCHVGNWEGKEYICYCSGKGELKACSIGTRGSGKIGKYNKYLLRKKLFRRHNPQNDQQSSKQAEESLAGALRRMGYGVWTN